MAKKHQFHCSACGSEADIYKKGKNHRVLVCQKCGVLASNPIPLLLAGAVSTAIKYAPSAISAGKKVLGSIDKGNEPTQQSSFTSSRPLSHSCYNKPDRVMQALGAR